MARRPRRRLLALLIITSLVAVACQDDTAPSTSGSESATTMPTTTSLTTSTTLDPGSTTTTGPITAPPTADALVPSGLRIPDGEGPFPAVVLVHGGGWVVGNPTSIEPLAIYLSENGYITINATYQLSLQTPGFPTAVDDIACAVRLAASLPQSNGEVTVIGHSAGAHVGSLVALGGDAYATDCPYPGSGVPDRFIGLAGPYDVSRLGPIMVAFFGSNPSDDLDTWERGNPQLNAGANPALRSLLIHGGVDQVVPVEFSENFHTALVDAGGDSEILVLPGADHSGARNPVIVGELILDWLDDE